MNRLTLQTVEKQHKMDDKLRSEQELNELLESNTKLAGQAKVKLYVHATRSTFLRLL